MIHNPKHRAFLIMIGQNCRPNLIGFAGQSNSLALTLFRVVIVFGCEYPVYLSPCGDNVPCHQKVYILILIPDSLMILSMATNMLDPNFWVGLILRFQKVQVSPGI